MGTIADTIDIRQINRMDTPAFRRLYSVFYKVMVSCAFKITADINASEDIVQEVFTNLWEHKRIFNTTAALQAFFYSSVHNAALNYMKHQNIVNRYAQQVTANDHGAAATASDEFYSEEVYRRLFSLIDALPARQREVFLLQMEGKSNSEIATALNIAVETVKIHKKRGMAYLRKHVDSSCLITILLLLSGFTPPE